MHYNLQVYQSAMSLVMDGQLSSARFASPFEGHDRDFHTLFESMPLGVVFQNQAGAILTANRAAEQILGLSLAQMQDRTSLDPRWRAFRADGSDLPGEEHPAMVALRTGQPVDNFVMGIFNPRLNEHRWLAVHAVPQFKEGESRPYQVYTIFSDVTPRRQIETALRESEALSQQRLLELETIYNSASVGLGVLDRNLRFVRINRHLAEINGPSVEEHLGRTVREIVPKLADEAEPVLRRILETGQPVLDLEIRGETPAQPGVERSWRENWLPLTDDQGQVVGINIVAVETTERRRAEAALRQSEQRARDIIDNLFTFVGLMTPAGLLIEANRAALEAASLQAGDVLSKPFEEAYWWSYSPQVQAQLRAAIERGRAGERSRYDVTIRLAEDRYIIIDFMLAPVFNAQGQVTYLVPSGLDITDRVHARQRLAAEHAISRVLAEAKSLSEAAPRILQALCQNLGADICELWLPAEGNSPPLQCVAFYTPHTSEAAREFEQITRQQAFKSGQGLPGRIWQQRRPVWSTDLQQDLGFVRFEAALKLELCTKIAFPILDGDDCLGVVSLFSRQAVQPDLPLLNMMTAVGRNLGQFMQRTRAEAALRQSHDLLEQRVAERTAELERSLKELDQFTYVTSHDLKAPLRAIQHLAGWIAEDSGPLLPEPSLRHLEKMQGRITRLEQMLDDLLAYSRAGRRYSEVSEVDTAALLGEVIDLLEPPAGFVITIGPGLPKLITYRTPLELVFRNLLQNAIKHHHRAEGRIQVTAHDLGNSVEFAVQDDGPGIDPAYHERIFQLFQTLRPRDEVEGSGIGLAVVQKTVETQGGTISLSSTAGQGATFRFTWPKKPPQ